jgi:hypothetical protein
MKAFADSRHPLIRVFVFLSHVMYLTERKPDWGENPATSQSLENSQTTFGRPTRPPSL